MANEKDTQQNENKSGKPASNANPQPMPENYSNEANFKGAVDLGTDGTKATASQQQGQGAWNAKDHDNTGKRANAQGNNAEDNSNA